MQAPYKMKYEPHPHWYTDIILKSDYALKQEIEEIIRSISDVSVLSEFEQAKKRRDTVGMRPAKCKQSSINTIFIDFLCEWTFSEMIEGLFVAEILIMMWLVAK